MLEIYPFSLTTGDCQGDHRQPVGLCVGDFSNQCPRDCHQPPTTSHNRPGNTHFHNWWLPGRHRLSLGSCDWSLIHLILHYHPFKMAITWLMITCLSDLNTRYVCNHRYRIQVAFKRKTSFHWSFTFQNLYLKTVHVLCDLWSVQWSEEKMIWEHKHNIELRVFQDATRGSVYYCLPWRLSLAVVVSAFPRSQLWFWKPSSCLLFMSILNLVWSASPSLLSLPRYLSNSCAPVCCRSAFLASRFWWFSSSGCLPSLFVWFGCRFASFAC